jgi:hypothetical protein
MSRNMDMLPRIHVERERFVGKFWLSHVRLQDNGLQDNGGFSRRELNIIQRLVEEHRTHFIRS